MDILLEAYRHNAWANDRIFEAATRLSDDQLETAMPGIFGGVRATAQHLVEVEDGFLAVITAPDNWERLPVLSIIQLRETLADRDRRYIELVADAGDLELDRRVHIPWFRREATVGDCLFQVLSHSTEHRADLASAITGLGGTTPPIDYIMFALGVADNVP